MELVKYRSIKEVHGEPMSNEQWENFRVDVLLANAKNYSTADTKAGSQYRDGYHVVYNLGEDNEYHSWSPKKEFEEGNVLV